LRHRREVGECPENLCHEKTDLTYEGIETPVVGAQTGLVPGREKTDLTYEGIETPLLVSTTTRRWREKTDLTYEGIETVAF